MRCGTLIPATLAIGIAFSGCAVLTVDVDVYKGALSNHESVQTEQVAAMAMGAKPLLAELRYKLEQAACSRSPDDEKKKETSGYLDRSRASIEGAKCPDSANNAGLKTDFIPPNSLRSRDAQRVNEILSLYEDTSGPLLRPLSEATSRLLDRIKEAKRILVPYFEGGSDRTKYQRAQVLAKLTLEVRSQTVKGRPIQIPESVKDEVAAIKLAWEAAEETWQEAIRVLSSVEIRRSLKELRKDTIWDVAYVAADLTSGEGLRRFLTDMTLAQLRRGPLTELGRLLPMLTQGTALTSDDEEAVAAVLTQVLADEGRGPALAKHLAMAQSYAATNPTLEWFIVLYPTPATLLQIDEEALEDLRGIRKINAGGIALGAGRPNDGLEKLIDEYLKASRLSTDSQSKKTIATRKELHDGLVNFAEKVTIIANFDPLVRDPQPWYKPKFLFGLPDADKYVRVLQAVGNSILSQVDALRQLEAHRSGLTQARDTEVAGIRNAEARAAAVLKEITAELKKQPPNFPDKTVIQTKLDKGGEALDDVIAQIEATSGTQRGLLDTEQKNAAKWAAASTILGQKEVREAVEQFGKASAPRTTADVAREIIGVLEKRETEARRPGGAGDDVATEIEMAIVALNDQKFTADIANPGPADDKYRRILLEVGRARAAAADEAAAAKWERIVVVLERQDVRDAVEQFGKTIVLRTTAEVTGETIRVLQKLENDAGRPGGAGVKEARRIQTAADALGDSRFTADKTNPSAVSEKYRLIQNLVNRERDATRTIEADREAIVATLDRWNLQVAVMRTEARARLGIPDRIEKGKVYDGQKPTAKDVLDVMVATLRYEHVNAMKEHGPDNPITKNLAAAVELNFAYRSGMVHIRPASTFLRNSYPASILQQDPSAGVWRNMLTDHAAHQLPFYDWFQGQKEEAKINNAIDKQFWQSVNQVRVSGTGITNYVIAKDDVGNWYVKSYSSNPEPIIKSAKNLAMFSAGSAMGANFLAKGAQPGATGGAIPQEIRSTLGKQYDSVSERYEKATRNARTELAKEIGALNSKVRGALSGGKLTEADLKQMFPDPDPNDAKPEAKDAKPAAKDAKPNPELAELIKTLEEDKQDKQKEKALKEEKQKGDTLKPISTLNAEIANGLRAIKRYRSQVQSKLNTMIAPEEKPAVPKDGEEKTPDPQPADPKKLTAKEGEEAKKAVDKIFKDLLEKHINERKTASGEYESALMLINEFAGL